MRKIIFTLTLLAALTVFNFCQAMQVKMLNVGQGDSILIQTDNRNILVDTSDAKERDKLLDELQKAGVNKIHTLILSHAHADHIANASYLIRHFNVDSLYDNGFPSTSIYSRNYLRAASEEGVDYQSIQRGDVIVLDAETFFEVVYPSDEFDGLSVNNQSIVGRLVYRNFRMLFTGDTENQAETDILYSNDKIASSVLKAAHHGSKTSSLYNFVEAVNPSYVLISAGVNNKYGHPHFDSIAAYLKLGVPSKNILCTAFNGTITIDTDGSGFTVTSERVNNWANDYVADKKLSVTKARRIG